MGREREREKTPFEGGDSDLNEGRVVKNLVPADAVKRDTRVLPIMTRGVESAQVVEPKGKAKSGRKDHGRARVVVEYEKFSSKDKAKAMIKKH